MGLELPKRARTVALGVVTGSALLFLTGCSADDRAQIKRLAMPIPSSKEAHSMYDLWHWSWLAAMVTGVIVWGLIAYNPGVYLGLGPCTIATATARLSVTTGAGETCSSTS